MEEKIKKVRSTTFKVNLTILLVILIIATIGSVFAFLELSLLIWGGKDFIFFSIPTYIMVLWLGFELFVFALLIIVYYEILGKPKMKSKNEIIEFVVALQKRFSMKTIIITNSVIVVLLCLFCLSSFNAFYYDKTVVQRCFVEKTYTLKDIDYVETGITGWFNVNQNSLYYELHFKDGRKASVFGSGYESNGDDKNNLLYDLDKYYKSRG